MLMRGIATAAGVELEAVFITDIGASPDGARRLADSTTVSFEIAVAADVGPIPETERQKSQGAGLLGSIRSVVFLNFPLFLGLRSV